MTQTDRQDARQERMMAKEIIYLATDAHGRTIERLDAETIEAARAMAKGIDCPCGVWLCPSVEGEDGLIGIGADEEIKPERE